ncbi:MAG: hypothetical protein C5B50_16150 [Verrucomicrobia bacterium]|nr:MAG: hypothetical protein C5B50_16150 [Verrucomicrobiota bacterium]
MNREQIIQRWSNVLAYAIVPLLVAYAVIARAFCPGDGLPIDAGDEPAETFVQVPMALKSLASGHIPKINLFNNFGTPILGEPVVYPFAPHALSYAVFRPVIAMLVNKFLLAALTMLVLTLFYARYFPTLLSSACAFLAFTSPAFFYFFQNHPHQGALLYFGLVLLALRHFMEAPGGCAASGIQNTRTETMNTLPQTLGRPFPVGLKSRSIGTAEGERAGLPAEALAKAGVRGKSVVRRLWLGAPKRSEGGSVVSSSVSWRGFCFYAAVSVFLLGVGINGALLGTAFIWAFAVLLGWQKPKSLLYALALWIAAFVTVHPHYIEFFKLAAHSARKDLRYQELIALPFWNTIKGLVRFSPETQIPQAILYYSWPVLLLITAGLFLMLRRSSVARLCRGRRQESPNRPHALNHRTQVRNETGQRFSLGLKSRSIGTAEGERAGVRGNFGFDALGEEFQNPAGSPAQCGPTIGTATTETQLLTFCLGLLPFLFVLLCHLFPTLPSAIPFIRSTNITRFLWFSDIFLMLPVGWALHTLWIKSVSTVALVPSSNTPARRVRAPGLQDEAIELVGRVPSRGAPSRCAEEPEKSSPAHVPDQTQRRNRFWSPALLVVLLLSCAAIRIPVFHLLANLAETSEGWTHFQPYQFLNFMLPGTRLATLAPPLILSHDTKVNSYGILGSAGRSIILDGVFKQFLEDNQLIESAFHGMTYFFRPAPPEKLGHFGIRYCITTGPEDPLPKLGWKQICQERGGPKDSQWFLDESPFPVTPFYLIKGKAVGFLQEYVIKDNDIEIQVPLLDSPTELIATFLARSGWKAFLDNKPIPITRGQDCLMSIQVQPAALPASTQSPPPLRKLLLRYEPFTDAYLLGCPIVSLAAALAVCWFLRSRKLDGYGGTGITNR